jgi:hypothetical protein
MMTFSSNRQLCFSAVICAFFFLSACATTQSTQVLIEQRATARWEALLSGDLAGAYEYLSPGYRSSVPSLQYQRSVLTQRVNWTGARYLESECEEATCTVKVSLDYAITGALPGVRTYKGTRTVKESWVLVDGTWYLVP